MRKTEPICEGWGRMSAARSSRVCEAVAAASAAPGGADASPELLRVTLLYVLRRLPFSLCVTERTVDIHVPDVNHTQSENY
ncbi:hypothetical protein ABVT39_004766 [Epinephelus coioides]